MRTALLFAIPLAMLASHVAGQECGIHDLRRLDLPTQRARTAVGDATHDLNSARVFVTVDDGDLFVETNYRIPGHDHPSRLLIDHDASLEEVVLNLLWDGKGPAPDARRAISENLTFIVEEFQLRRSRYSYLDFSHARRVERAITQQSESVSGVATNNAPVHDADMPLATSARIENQAAQQQPPGNVAPSALQSVPKDREPPQTSSSRRPITTTAIPAVDTSLGNAVKPEPKTFVEAFLAIAWTSLFGRVLIVVVALTISLLAVWHTFPDAIKERALLSFVKRRKRKRAT